MLHLFRINLGSNNKAFLVMEITQVILCDSHGFFQMYLKCSKVKEILRKQTSKPW